ncbi:MAG: hypothetical protein EBZ48_13070 [Proteobacteria bacterium]|nr:hypothetical protein [Pseudomonadota bacterium]
MRAISRLIALILRWVLSPLPPKRGGAEILLIHQLLVGDGILIWPLLQHLKDKQNVAIACPRALIGLYKRFFPSFYYFPFTEKDPAGVLRLLWAMRKCKQVICPIESRLHRYATALHPESVIGYGARKEQKKGITLSPLPTSQMTFSDMMSRLVDSSKSLYIPPQPVDDSRNKMCIIHIDAKNPNRRWTTSRWQELAEQLRKNGFEILWCGGTASVDLVPTLFKSGDKVLTPKDLLTYLDEIRSAALLVCPDTGITHLAKLTSTPTIVIYGQGNPALHGNGEYWSNARTLNIFQEQIPCRDKDTVMGFKVDWLRRCDRTPSECQNPFCQNNISVQDIIESARLRFPELFLKPPPTPQCPA